MAATSQARCPACGLRFASARGAGPEALRGRLVYGPERLVVNAKLDAAAFEVCPSCGKRFVSDQFRVFGEFVRARLHSMGGIYALVVVLIAAIAAVVWIGSP
jgi:hypothetical protein